MRKLQPGRHGQGRGELGVGQCRNELTNSYVPKQKTEKRVEEKSCTIPPMGPRVDGPAGRVGWACGSHRMGPRVASDGPSGRVGRSCCTANRAEEGNAARMRREERLDRQGSGKRADAEIANRTARSGQRRPGRSGGQRIGECSASRTEDKGGVCSIWDLTQHSPAQSRDAA